MPRIGLGVWQNKGESCLTACVAAIEHGYRYVSFSSEGCLPSFISWLDSICYVLMGAEISGTLTLRTRIVTRWRSVKP